ncbi:LysM peptidoglycan-binding domain-containing protein [Microbacter margulisiae]|uniref:LysM repeat protein n=1 Tax=Microbacter margulisiae TaxID=1350067 RepID=A0A7W5H2V7_9PORP|nr:LysM peptidoglycan-binding domain-containing protein [Microbacter margulisiae]MBB3187772.1 LysM repeat protein [Microbacter margulisiae]
MRHYLLSVLLWVNVMAISAQSFKQNTELRDAIVEYAKTLLHKPYHLGDKGPNGFDCSGFTHYVFQRFGFLLGESSREQVFDGIKVAIDDLKKGDLIFFKGSNSRRDRIGHVGIVIGKNSDGGVNFIHAALDGGVRIDNTQEAYYAKRYVTSRSVFQSSAATQYTANDMPFSTDEFASASSSADPVSLADVVDHRVQKGESLYVIAHRYHVTEKQIKEWNHLSNNKIKPGQKLIINTSSSDNVTSQSEESTSFHKIIHRVRKGESLYTIARRYHVNEEKLKEWNNLSSNEIKPGQKLIIDKKVIAESSNSKKITNTKETTASNNSDEPPVTKETIHRVHTGETLLSIAHKYHVTTKALKEWNHLSSNHLRKGMRLIIKQKEINTSIAQEPETTSNSNAEDSNIQQPSETTRVITVNKTHRVRSGESLYTIAREYHTNVAALKRLNHMHESMLQPGKVLIVGKKKKTIVSTQPKANQPEETINAPAPAPRAQETTTVNNKQTNDSTEIEHETSATKSAKGFTLQLKEPNENTPHNVVLDTLRTTYQAVEKHIVKEGETFSSIADKYHISVRDLKGWNGISYRQKTIDPGKTLLIQVNKTAFVVVSKPLHSKKTESKPDSATKTVSPQDQTATQHIVKKGETIYSIATQHHISVDQLRAFNHLRAKEKLRENQILRLTPADSIATQKTTTTTQEYVVKPGDTLLSVAKAYHTTVAEIKRINHLSKNELNIGQSLKILVDTEK